MSLTGEKGLDGGGDRIDEGDHVTQPYSVRRLLSAVRREEAGPDTARADRGYCAVGLRQELPADRQEVRPPHLFRVVLGSAGAGQRELVQPLGGGDDLAVRSRENTLGA
jgi:hypothetical protein